MAMSLNSFDLPASFCSEGDVKDAKGVSMVAKVEAHLLTLKLQESFFSLSKSLREDYPSIKSFSFDIGSHYNDEGYSPHINMNVTFENEEGNLERAESDEEYGGLPEEAEHLDEFRYEIDNLPDAVQKKLVGRNIDCSDERALALSIMGPVGFAAYEAEILNRSAGAGGKAAKMPHL